MYSLKQLIAESRYKAQESGVDKEEAENQVLKCEIKKLGNENLYEYFKFVEHLATSLNKSLTLSTDIIMTSLGQCDFSRNTIQISLKEEYDSEAKLKSVIVHELGEAEYILRNYPICRSEFVDEAPRFTELLSHYYIEHTLKKKNLYHLEAVFKDDQVKDCRNEWKVILKAVWILISFNHFVVKDKIPGYAEFSDIIDEI